jgi:hypothetical protein
MALIAPAAPVLDQHRPASGSGGPGLACILLNRVDSLLFSLHIPETRP